MVNTFITTFGADKDYSISAKHLDKRRVGKQRVEAKQILQIIEDLQLIAYYFSWKSIPYVKDEKKLSIKERYSLISNRQKWLDKIRVKYLSLDTRLLITPTQEIVLVNKGTKVKDSRVLSLGFSAHPIVKMWVGYAESLKMYINSHIREWCSRKNKDGSHCLSTMKVYDINKKPIAPWWRNHSGVVLSHKASLLKKEQLDRNLVEVKWYSSQEDFFDVSCSNWLDKEYIWASKLSKEDILTTLKKKKYRYDYNGYVKLSF